MSDDATGEERAPPAVSERLLRWSLRSAGVVGETIVGDLREEHAAVTAERSGAAADRWYRRQATGVIARALRDRVRRRGAFHDRGVARQSGKGDPMMARLWNETRHAARGLLRAPQFAVVSVLTLALAIGANAAVFAVVKSVLLDPLPYPESQRLVTIWHSAPGLGYDAFGASPGLYVLYAEQAPDAFEELGLLRETQVNLTGEEATPERLEAALVTHTVFGVVGVSPMLGRGFMAEEDVPDGAPVVVLSEELWRTRFGADPTILGSTIRIDGTARQVVGVMPARFGFPEPETRLWLPLGLNLAEANPGQFAYMAIGRLRPGVTPEAAQPRLAAAVTRVPERFPDASDFRAFIESGRFAPGVHTLHEETVGDLKLPLWILLGTVGFVFLIACANVTNLFLVRAEARQREMAVRAALGARRGGLIRQYLLESVLLAVAGGAVGVPLAWVGMRALLGVAPPAIPRLDEVALDGGVVAFALLVMALASVLLALMPATRLASPTLLATLGQARGSTAGRDRQRVRRLLVVGQTALALVLLAGSGLMVRSFQNLRTIDPGFDPEDVLTFRISLPASEYPDAAANAAFHEQLLDRLRGLPGVQAAAAVADLPLSGARGTAFQIEERPTVPGELPPMIWYTYATPDYFEALRIPLIEGRLLERSDAEPARRNVVVGATLAREIWPDGSAVGKRLRASGNEEASWSTIVGVVGDVRDRGLEEEPGQMIYYPVSGSEDQGLAAGSMTYIVRSQNPSALIGSARNAVHAIDPNLPIAAVEPLERIVADSMVRMSFTMLALVVAASVALLLGAVGLYGVISYLVAQRTREIGVRMALGADAAAVRRMIVLQGVRLAALGLVLGFAAAVAMTRLLQGLLYGTSATDPITFAAVTGLLAAVALVASYLPARRASRIDPARSLQSE